MKNKIWNATHISGRLYQHSLEMKTTKPDSKVPNTQYINGNVEIATDDAMTNIVTVHFSFTTATTSKGAANATFKVLAGIIDGTYKSVMQHGKDAATLMMIDSAIGLNEFYSDRNGTEELVSAKRNEGGFVRIINELEANEKVRNTFDTDIILYRTRHLEADEENNLPEKLILCGYIMDFRKSFLPVEYSVVSPGAIAYFEGLEASEKNPVFTRVKGVQVSQTIVKRIEEESAFGEPSVREYTNTKKDFIVTWGAKEPYTIGPDGDITPAEIKQGLADRETTLATIKKNQEEWKAKQNGGTSAFVTSDTDTNFDF